MDILELFFWFCKEQKIMDIMYLLYQEKKPTKTEYMEDNLTRYQKVLSLKELLIDEIKINGFLDMFWWLQMKFNSINKKLINSERYKKARSKWNLFVKNNVNFSEDYVKVGDVISMTYGFCTDVTIEKKVIAIPKKFNGRVMVSYTDYDGVVTNEEMRLITNYPEIKINGVNKTPKFFIKKRRKIYGIS